MAKKPAARKPFMIRLSVKEHAELRIAAAIADLSLSEYVRAAVASSDPKCVKRFVADELYRKATA